MADGTAVRIKEWVSNFSRGSESFGGLVKTQTARLQLQYFVIVLTWGQIICISSKSTGYADGPGPTHFESHCYTRKQVRSALAPFGCDLKEGKKNFAISLSLTLPQKTFQTLILGNILTAPDIP